MWRSINSKGDKMSNFGKGTFVYHKLDGKRMIVLSKRESIEGPIYTCRYLQPVTSHYVGSDFYGIELTEKEPEI
jgi:hypothetical protein